MSDTRRLAGALAESSPAARRRQPWHVDVPGERSVVFCRPVRQLMPSIAASTPRPSASPPPIPRSLWLDQHRAAPDQQPDHDGRAARRRPRDMRDVTLVLPCRHGRARARVPHLQRSGISRRSPGASVPGTGFSPAPPATQMFWGLYWIMTGIHAIHLSGGHRHRFWSYSSFLAPDHPGAGSTMEGVAIYWHFVDAIWLVLYPLLYLAGRS